MDWRSWWHTSGLRLTVGLTMSVAVLSVLTGIANVGTQTLLGPLAGIVPREIQRAVGFTGALTGFLMMASALGLRRGLRAAWYSTVVLLPATALQGLLQSSPLSLPLVVLSLLAFPNVLAHRQRFDRGLALTTSQTAAVAAIVGAQVYGTIGAYALRDDFTTINTLVDAFYYTLVTASTVGYGDATPTSQMARLFGMSVIVVGTASFAIALGTLLGPAIQARLSQALGRMTQSQLELLENHLLVLGHGELTEIVLEELSDDEIAYLIISLDSEWALQVRERDDNVLIGDPSDEDTLKRARIGDSRAVLVATNNDAEDALAILTARHLNPTVTIVAAATNRENIDKLKRAGANTVISPASIGGHLLVESALGRTGIEDIAQRIVETDEIPDLQ